LHDLDACYSVLCLWCRVFDVWHVGCIVRLGCIIRERAISNKLCIIQVG